MPRTTKVLSSYRQGGPCTEWRGIGGLTCLRPHLEPPLPLWFPLGSSGGNVLRKGKPPLVSHGKAFCLGVDNPGRLILLGRSQGKLTLGARGQMISGKTTQLYHDSV